MNSWDRTSYLSDVLGGPGSASYASKMNNVRRNFIIANYGASQAFDTDDGSSYYNITHNFMFEADSWKMDYGGEHPRRRRRGAHARLHPPTLDARRQPNNTHCRSNTVHRSNTVRHAP